MSTRRKLLTAKAVEGEKTLGRYSCGRGLYLDVSKSGVKSWVVFFSRHRFGRKGRGELWLNKKYPALSLADARVECGLILQQVRDGLDPVAERRRKRQGRELSPAKSKDFLEVAENLFVVKTAGDRPWWGKHAYNKNRRILDGILKPLHHLPINSAEAADLITLKLHALMTATIKNRARKNRVGPRYQVTPDMACDIQDLAIAICARAHALKVLPITVANPADDPLDVLLPMRRPKGGHWPAIPYQEAPALYAAVAQMGRPMSGGYSVREAARVTATPNYRIQRMIEARELHATAIPRAVNSAPIDYEWSIERDDLIAASLSIVNDIPPGLKSVVWDLIMFEMLIGLRPSEARLLRWTQYDQVERMVSISWQETKEGEDIRQNMVIPLSDPANDIIMKLRDLQGRFGMQTEYVFANYPCRFARTAKINQPPCGATVLDNLRLALPPQYIKATMHGMRTSIRSWGEDQRRPDGTPRFTEKDLERAIGHAAGFGTTEMARLYSRQSSDIIPLIPIFAGWARYIISGGKPADVIPIRRTVGD